MISFALIGGKVMQRRGLLPTDFQEMIDRAGFRLAVVLMLAIAFARGGHLKRSIGITRSRNQPRREETVTCATCPGSLSLLALVSVECGLCRGYATETCTCGTERTNHIEQIELLNSKLREGGPERVHR